MTKIIPSLFLILFLRLFTALKVWYDAFNGQNVSMFTKKDLLSMVGLLDLHTHTTASGYAYSPLYEMVHSASAEGLSLFGCSDHAPTIPGSCRPFHFINPKVLPRTLYGVGLMMGVKLSIMDYDGTVDLEWSVLEPLDYATASLYQPCVHSGTALQNTNTYLEALGNPLIHIIGHPDDSRFSIDYDMLAAVAGKRHKLLEVNNSSSDPLSFHVGARDNYIKTLELCRHYGTSIIIDSDTYYETDAGNRAFARALLEEVNFLRELIVNASLDQLCCSLPKAAVILAQREDECCGHPYRPITTGEGSTPGGNES